MIRIAPSRARPAAVVASSACARFRHGHRVARKTGVGPARPISPRQKEMERFQLPALQEAGAADEQAGSISGDRRPARLKGGAVRFKREMIRTRESAAGVAEINRKCRARRVRDEGARQKERGKADRTLVVIIGKRRRTLDRRLCCRPAVPSAGRLLSGIGGALIGEVASMEVPERQAKLQHQRRERETAAASLHEGLQKLFVCPRQPDHVPNREWI
jgi:hypothetical protein